jgi:voltage-gated potassium channel
MTVLTIRAMAREVYICVELLDKKYEHYLKQAMCDEIILSRDYSRMLLANSTNTSGIAHIVHQMIDRLDPPERKIKLTTLKVPGEFVGQPYARYASFVNSQERRLLLGILENTGSPNAIKMEALRDAQKTSDVSKLVSNLKEVKALEVNRPVLMPDDDHTIQQHSLGIVLERE